MNRLPVPALLLGLTSVLVCLAYSSGMQGPALLDDWGQLGEVLQYKEMGQSPWALLQSPSGPLGRPVAMFSFLINASMSGDSFYHLKATNVALHVVTGWLVFFFVRALMRCCHPTEVQARWAALAIAALWLVHPLLVSTVLYTVQRMVILATLFSLCSLLCWMKARTSETGHAPLWFALSICSWILAMLSKETALLVPLQIAAIEFFLMPRRTFAIWSRLVANRNHVIALLVVALLPASWLLIDYFAAAYQGRSFTPWERLLTESRVMVSYVSMILLPLQSRMGFMHDDVEISTSLVSPWTTLPSLLVVLILVGVPFLLRKRQPLLAFGLMFFMVGHLLESTVFPLELMFEHRNYLPSLGILLAVYVIAKQVLTDRRFIATIGLALFATLTMLTFVRAHTWSNETLLLNYFLQTHPDSPRLAIIFARELANQEQHGQALELLARHDSMAHYLERLRIECAREGRLADSQFEDMARWRGRPVDTAASQALMLLANDGLDNACEFSHETFLAVLEAALKGKTVGEYSRDKLLIYKAHYQWSLQQSEAAIDTLYEIHQLHASNPVPLFLAAEWLSEMGDVERARRTYQQALEISRTSARNYRSFEESVNAVISQAEAAK